MKQFFKQIASITLAFLVLLSTFSFTVEKHYCGDFLVDVSYIGKTEGCGMEIISSTKKKNCCKDEIEKIEGQNELQITKIQVHLEKQQFLTDFLISHEDSFAVISSQKEFFKDFPPPDIYQDYQVLFQSFLI